MLLLDLLGAPAGSRLDRAILTGDTLTLVLTTTAPTASCPTCGTESWSVHSRYTRRLADLPGFGLRVRLQVIARRFCCPNVECPRRIFVERLAKLAAPHARATARLAETQHEIGSALGGEAGARLAARMSMTISPDTLLRRVKQAGVEFASSPRLIGIDDWAWCKGQRYGTIVVDLERGDVIDLLPDRDAKTVGKWLKAHPGVELVSRDRSSAYSLAATDFAPQARQVADRWHLLKNVREVIERLFERQATVVGDALKSAETDSGSTGSPAVVEGPEITLAADQALPESPEEPAPGSFQQEAEPAKRRRRVERFERAHELSGQGISVRQIAHELDLSRNSVRRYLRLEVCPDWGPGRPKRSRLDAHQEWIDARLAEGCENASELHRELVAKGLRLSYGSVRRYVTKRLGAAGKNRPRVNAAKAPVPPPPSAKQLSFDWVRRCEDRKPAAQARLDAIRAGSPELATALDLADEFADLIRKRSSGTLKEWLMRAEACSCPEIRQFADGIRRDEAAVSAAVTERWSNGPVEGHVNRLKTIKRQMYGRAGFTLLRARVVSVA